MQPDKTKTSVAVDSSSSASSTHSDGATALTKKQKVLAFLKTVPNRIPEITISRAIFYGIFLVYHFVMLGIYLRGTSGSLAVRMYFINDLAMDIIMLDLAIALLAQCYETMRFLRLTFVPRFINFERNIAVHRLMGLFVVKFSLIHTVGEYKGLYEVSRSFFARNTYRWYLLERTSGWTGHVLLVLLVVMVVLSIGPIRRKHYELFRFSHQIIFVIVIPFLYIHGKERAKIHMYVSAPLALFVLDKTWRYVRRVRGLAHIEWVRFFPGQAVEVRIYGPSIKFRHGQHLRINCPSIAPLQWHPYSLTSDPADPDGYTFQLKVRGDWSLAFAQRLGAPEWFLEECRFEKARAEAEAKKSKARRNKKIKKHLPFSRSKWEDDESIAESTKMHAPHVTVHSDSNKPAYTTVRETHDMPKICIDGPYTGTLEYATNYKQVVLVAGGNGLNPMISYLYAVVGQLKKQAAKAKQAGSTEVPEPPKIDLIWVVRSKGCLSWYPDLWEMLRESGLEINMHLHYTRKAMEDEDDVDTSVRADSADTSREIDTVSNASDEFSDPGHNGLGRVRFGRPQMKSIIGEIARDAPHKRIGVFICGPPKLCSDTSRASHYWAYRLVRQQRTWLEVHDEPY